MNDQAATLRLAVFPRSGLLVDALLALGGAAFVGLAAQVSFHLGFTPVPITGQTFAVLLVGAAYGSVLGAASLSLYVLLGIAGVPWYSEQDHGWKVFSGATGGYIVGFVLAAALTGFLAEVLEALRIYFELKAAHITLDKKLRSGKGVGSRQFLSSVCAKLTGECEE